MKDVSWQKGSIYTHSTKRMFVLGIRRCTMNYGSNLNFLNMIFICYDNLWCKFKWWLVIFSSCRCLAGSELDWYWYERRSEGSPAPLREICWRLLFLAHFLPPATALILQNLLLIFILNSQFLFLQECEWFEMIKKTAFTWCNTIRPRQTLQCDWSSN